MRIILDEKNEAYAQWLQGLPYTPALYGQIKLPSDICQLQHLNVFCHYVYPTPLLVHSKHDFSMFQGHAILAVRNDTVPTLDQSILSQMPGELKMFLSIDTTDVNEDNQGTHSMPVEYLQSLSLPSLPLSKLELRISTPVILLRNL
jgi:hypothetical protein